LLAYVRSVGTALSNDPREIVECLTEDDRAFAEWIRAPAWSRISSTIHRRGENQAGGVTPITSVAP